MDNGLLVCVHNIDHHMFVRRQILSRNQRRGRSRCPRKKSLADSGGRCSDPCNAPTPNNEQREM